MTDTQHVFEFLYQYPAPAQRSGFDIRLAYTPTPEPATLALTLGGLAVVEAAAWMRRRA